MEHKLELLSPAGEMETLKYAVQYGADAIYLGASDYGMRAGAKNFSLEKDLAEAVEYAHKHGKKVYLTVNTLPTNKEMTRIPQFLIAAAGTGVDAFIVADVGVMSLATQVAPNVELHISTQMGVMNYATANTLYNLGAKRVVLARELSLEEIAFIRMNTPPGLELEAFVHGAMCMSVSGRCLISHYLTGRDANRGACAQPCRWEWDLREKSRPGEVYTIGEGEDYSYILNADDLCMAPFINLLADAGISSFKIEGRAKSSYYVASVTSAYRKALDAYKMNEEYLCPQEVLEELTKTSHRKYSTGFYFGREGATQNTQTGGYYRDWEVLAAVEETKSGRVFCTQRGKFSAEDTVEALTPSGEIFLLSWEDLRDENSEPIESTPHPMMKFSFKCDKILPKYTLLRKKRK
jgi:Collagenase and related proteases